MCNRYRNLATASQLPERFGIEISEEWGRLGQPELFPKRLAWTIREAKGARLAEPMA